MTSAREYMEMALALAEKGRGWTAPNPMVGAVVVKDGQVVGKGFHPYYGGPHAEVYAIDEAGDRARGASLYVTLEPCNHAGKTPPCTEKILSAGIRSVVMAMKDPNPGVKGGGAAYLAQQGVAVQAGLCEDQARKQNEAFIKHITTGRPFVILKCAATLDGRIAAKSGDAKWVTNAASRRFVHQLRHHCTGILVGSGTVRADDPSLTTRLEGISAKDPHRIILDTRLSVSEKAKLLHQPSDADTVFVCGPRVSASKRALVEGRGATVLTAAIKDGMIDLAALMPRLGEMGISSLLIEGGSRVNASALKAGIVDKVYFFYAPKILGGNDGIPICKGSGPELMKDAIQIDDISVHRFEDDVMIEGYIRPKP